MAVTDPDCPFNLAWRMGVEVVGATARLPVPVLYDPHHHLIVVSPDYSLEEYQDAADELLSHVASRTARSA